MRHDPHTILGDAIRAAEDISAMLGEMTEQQFLADLRTRAVERSFEIVEEALARLSRDFPSIAS